MKLSKRTQRVLDLLTAAGSRGCTRDEMNVKLGYDIGGSQGLQFLGLAGLAHPNGEMRTTRCHNAAAVWVAGAGDYVPRSNKMDKPLPRRIGWIETKALHHIFANPGATAHEIAAAIGAIVETVRPQLTRLYYLKLATRKRDQTSPFGKPCFGYSA